MARSGREKPDISPEEFKLLENAMKNEQFKKMFVEYANELANPENRKLYEEEIARMEADKGKRVQVVIPKPSFVAKTAYVDGGKKVFINMCESDKVGKSEFRNAEYHEKQGQHWQIPFSFTFAREDLDSSGKRVDVFEAIFHPDTCEHGLRDIRFRKLMLDSAMSGIEKKNKVQFDRKRIRFPKMKFKGTPKPLVIRKETTEGQDVETSHQDKAQPKHDEQSMKEQALDENDKQQAKGKARDKQDTQLAKGTVQSECDALQQVRGERLDESDSQSTKEIDKCNEDLCTNDVVMEVPHYTVVHRGFVDFQDYTLARDAAPAKRPRELVVSVELPRCKSASSVSLDVFEKKIILESKKQRYGLDLSLPYPIDDSKGEAKFDKSKRRLTITLSVIPVTMSQKDLQAANETTFTGSCPHYTFQQDEETATFILHVSHVSIDSITKNISPDKVDLKFQNYSENDRNEYTCYSFCVLFASGHEIVVDKTNIEVLRETVIILVWKDPQCQGIWQSFQAGASADCLEERMFLTVENVADAVKKIEDPRNDPWRSEEAQSFTCTVSEMTDQHVTVQLDQSPQTKVDTSVDTKECQLQTDETAPVVVEKPVSYDVDTEGKKVVAQKTQNNNVSHCWPRLEEECKAQRDISRVASEDKHSADRGGTDSKTHTSGDEEVDVHTECEQLAETIEKETASTSDEDIKLLIEDKVADSSSDFHQTHVQLSSSMMFDLDY
ncbi:protein kintoun-like [Corticium candelabrum]|uniref:protein kintoun-like n=1 Tax=Corticium candelabrum TaxID=121492 RepID=UPI002E267EBF|nr:protein kintoun-like [Corticium candelabrum]